MKTILKLLVPALALTLLSCSDDDSDTLNIPDISQEECISKHFYYYNDGATDMSSRIAYDRVLIGFYGTVADAHIIATVNAQDELDNVSAERVSDQEGFKYITATFKTTKTCPEIYAFIEAMKAKTAVAFGNYVYEGGIEFFNSPPGYTSYTDEFLVKVPDINDLSALEAVAAETNTTIKGPASGNWFILSATKNSEGDAMDMANYFYETGNFEHTSPNFTMWAEEQ